MAHSSARFAWTSLAQIFTARQLTSPGFCLIVAKRGGKAFKRRESWPLLELPFPSRKLICVTLVPADPSG